MNFMSSMAKTFVGSTIASVSVAPTRESGSTEYLSATSRGMRRMTDSSMSKSSRFTEGTPYWRESTAVIMSSETSPILTRLKPRRPPCSRWNSRASHNCCGVRRFSRTRISPSLADIFLETFRGLELRQGRARPSSGREDSPTTAQSASRQTRPNIVCHKHVTV